MPAEQECKVIELLEGYDATKLLWEVPYKSWKRQH